MSPEQLQQLCECIERSAQGGNLVPWREIYSETVALAASPAARRVAVRLEPSEYTRAFVAIIQPRPAPAEGDPSAVMFRVMSQQDGQASHTQLLAGNGRLVAAGGDYTHAIPRWARLWWIDLLGVVQGPAQPPVPAAATCDVVVYEMASADRQERC